MDTLVGAGDATLPGLETAAIFGLEVIAGSTDRAVGTVLTT